MVLGADYSALGLVQSLGSRGLKVWVLHQRRGIAGHSRWAAFRSCPDPSADRDAWIDRLAEICRRLPAPPVILASADAEAQALSHSEPLLREVARVRTLAPATIDTVLDKAAFGDWAARRGLSAPQTRRADLFAQDHRCLGWPILAKPRFRGRDATLRGGRVERFTLLRTASEWASFRHRHASRLHAMVVQPFVSGTTANMYCVGVCADRGSVRALFAGRKVRGFPSLYGDTTVGESVTLPGPVLDEVRRVVADLSLDGLAELEYKRDPNTGVFHLIELNPRAWSWIAASVAEGSDLPIVAWELASGQQISGRPPAASTAVRYVRVVPDLMNVCVRYRRDRPEWAQGPLAWWRDLRSPGLVVAENHLGDWRILPWSIAEAVRLELGARSRGPFVLGAAQGALDLAQTALQAAVGWFLPRRLWHRTALALAAARARVDPGFTRRSRHIERILGDRRLEHDAPRIEIRRSASAFLDGVAIFRELRPGGWSPELRIHGQRHVTAALDNGRGAILWLANIHHSRLILRRALHSVGFDCWHLSRPSHGFSSTALGVAALNPLWRRAEDRYLGRRLMIPSEGARATLAPLRALRRHLADNGVVSITVGDEADEVALTPFFAGSLALSTGPEKLARASGAPLLPVFAAVRDTGFEVWIEGPLELGNEGDPADERLADYARRLETRVSEDPDTYRVWAQASASKPMRQPLNQPGSQVVSSGLREGTATSRSGTNRLDR